MNDEANLSQAFRDFAEQRMQDAEITRRRKLNNVKHELKTQAPFFQATWAGAKSFEIRFNDREFKVNDQVVLLEIDEEGEYTGREIEGFIRYLSDFKQKDGYVVFSLDEYCRQDA